jgi:hypothetical protein
MALPAEIREIEREWYKSSKKLSFLSVFFGSELLAKTKAPLRLVSCMNGAISACFFVVNPSRAYEV